MPHLLRLAFVLGRHRLASLQLLVKEWLPFKGLLLPLWLVLSATCINLLIKFIALGDRWLQRALLCFKRLLRFGRHRRCYIVLPTIHLCLSVLSSIACSSRCPHFWSLDMRRLRLWHVHLPILAFSSSGGAAARFTRLIASHTRAIFATLIHLATARTLVVQATSLKHLIEVVHLEFSPLAMRPMSVHTINAQAVPSLYASVATCRG
mmetsp:Transcript_53118/g.98251  ORF Transcript_53118/g.98251 Transcript_53118/m.98251 type:complete len:207 (+) Transcript_53118:87-707(+)